MVIARLGSTVRSVLTAVLAIVVAIAGAFSPVALAVVLGVLVALFAVGWPRLVDLPSPRGSTAVIATTGFLAMGAVLVVGSLVPLLAVVALAIVAAFVHEMARRDGRPHLVESVSGTVLGAVAVASASGWMPLAGSSEAGALIVAATAALGVSALVTGLPLAMQWLTVAGVAGGALAGLVVGSAMPGISLVAGVLVGTGAAAVSVSTYVLFDRFETSERTAESAAIATMPVITVGVPVYAVASLLAL